MTIIQTKSQDYAEAWDKAAGDTRVQMFDGIDSQVHHTLTEQFITRNQRFLDEIYDEAGKTLDINDPRFLQRLPEQASGTQSLKEAGGGSAAIHRGLAGPHLDTVGGRDVDGAAMYLQQRLRGIQRAMQGPDGISAVEAVARFEAEAETITNGYTGHTPSDVVFFNNSDDPILMERYGMDPSRSGQLSDVEKETLREANRADLKNISDVVNAAIADGSVDPTKPMDLTNVQGEYKVNSAAKWFDLSEHGAKLDRKDGGFGHYRLELEVPAERLAPFVSETDNAGVGRALMDMGWQVEPKDGDRYLLTNHAPLNRKSEVESALRPFFSDHEIAESYGSIHLLKQNEVVEGLQPWQTLMEPHLTTDNIGIDPTHFDQIVARMKGVQDLAGAHIEERPSITFNGHGHALFNAATDTLVNEHGWGEIEASVAVADQMVKAVEQPNSVHGVRMTDYANAIVAANAAEDVKLGEQYLMGRIASEQGTWNGIDNSFAPSEALERQVQDINLSVDGGTASIRDAVLDTEDVLTPEVMGVAEVKPDITKMSVEAPQVEPTVSSAAPRIKPSASLSYDM